MPMPISSASGAFLSVRLPAATRDRLKVAAASRGESVQGLVGTLVERFLVEEAGVPPSLAVVLRRLRDHADELRSRGVMSLSVFGSVARGDAHPGSDVDLLAEFNPAANLSLIGLSSLRAELSELLGTPTDLVERAALRPTVREGAEREAVRVW